MLKITQPTVKLSLIITPPKDAARDEFSLNERISRLEQALESISDMSLFWASTRSSEELFDSFESQLRELLRAVGKAGTELMLATAEIKDRRERVKRYSIGETTYRVSGLEWRSLNTWFGIIRYGRSYSRPVEGGVGHFPLDLDIGLLSDRISPNLLSVGARLATRMSFAEAREVLGWFVPQPPSTEVLQRSVLGLGHHTAAWFAQVPPPEEDGEVLVVMIDGKCVPTARESELQKRRGERSKRTPAPSPRHRGRDMRKKRGRAPRRKKGDKSKNGKQVMMVVTYTLKREGALLLGPMNRRLYASFGKKRHAFEYALQEAERRGFGKKTDKTVQIVTDGDPDLHLYTDEYFNPVDFPSRVVTVDVVHVLEKLWDAGRARHSEGSKELASWVRAQENRLYGNKANLVVRDLRSWLEATPKTGPGNRGRRKRLSDAIRYLENRLDKVQYGTYRAQDLEVGTGQVEGAIKYIIAKRCDHGGMRWIRQRAQAVIQLRCIDVNGHWSTFIQWALTRLRTTTLANGLQTRLQTNNPAKLPKLIHAA